MNLLLDTQALLWFVLDDPRLLGDPFDRLIDIKTYMTEDILVKVDRMSMAHSLEVRAPILDHKLMEFAATLSSKLKLNNQESKYILKKINEKRLPNDILYRKKQGFSVPLAQWLRVGLTCGGLLWQQGRRVCMP